MSKFDLLLVPLLVLLLAPLLVLEMVLLLVREAGVLVRDDVDGRGRGRNDRMRWRGARCPGGNFSGKMLQMLWEIVRAKTNASSAVSDRVELAAVDGRGEGDDRRVGDHVGGVGESVRMQLSSQGRPAS